MSGSRSGRRKNRRQAVDPVRATAWAAPAGWLKGATLLLAAVCLLGLFSTEIADTDFWWHLRTGQYMVQHHALPVPDPFAYTTTAAAAYQGEDAVRHFNLTHEWLSQVLMYAVYAAGGFPGIVLARATLLAGLCGLAGWLAARLSKNFYAGIAAGCATGTVMAAFAADRPGVVSFLGVAAFVSLLELRRGWWALAPLALLWANCHGGFPLGWVVLAAYGIENLLRWRGGTWPRDSRRFWLAAAGAVAASLVNPNGFRVVSTMLAYRRSPMQANLIEWQPP
jgi:hypothetical protein